MVLFVHCTLLFCILAVGAGCERRERTVILEISGRKFVVEIADTPESRSRGLMHRKSLPDDRGMLFVFDRDQNLSFWMKNTEIPLSIAFMTKDGEIREIRDLTPHSLRPVESSHAVRLALEVPRGTFERLGVKAGDRIPIPEEVFSSIR